ncbi:MAG: hypothetical protein JKY42_11785 [Flavobacteriales bacterium]|nr:hypothetical protein [Flavobacteriales bacterium]
MLTVVKYNIDRILSEIFLENSWSLLGYVFGLNGKSLVELSNNEVGFFWILVATSIPFIAAGTILTLKRLKDIQLPFWLIMVFFIPFVNILFFIILCYLPTKEETFLISNHKNRYIDKLIPTSKMGSAMFAIGIVVLLTILFTLISIQVLEVYGWGLFLGIPFFLGLFSATIYGYHEHRTVRQCMGVALVSVIAFSALLLFSAIEGVICLAMAAPLGILIALIGSWIGFAIQDSRHYKKSLPGTLVIMVITIPAFMGFESQFKKPIELFSVTTRIEIEASRDNVWENVVTFSALPAPTELLFKSGISYPTQAIIEGTGVGSVRYCQFTTGDFVEPIEVWNKPELLAFSVLDQPVPMTEMTPYGVIDAPHIDGYFQSQKGQFLLKELPNGNTLLEGTTWYKHNIWPASYWKLWYDYIFHKIHYRVLKHIKNCSETK